ncbi:MAG TPA: hypothetical protein VM327_09325 [Candidatus Thermoplasmatota archaeon]|nr:hypothetical protein [Candidatus Thermoplasmatota archaeon]
MRRAAVPSLLCLALVMALLVAPVATSQPPTYTEAFQVRAAMGDIPTTAAVEAAGWNVDQRYTVEFTTGSNQKDVGFLLPPGATLVNASCGGCGDTPTVTAGSVTFHLVPSTPTGTYAMEVLSNQAVGRNFALKVERPESPGPGVVVLYAPKDLQVDAAVEPTAELPSTSGTARILEYRVALFPAPFWATIHPATTAGGDDPGTNAGAAGFNPWLMLAIGLVLGVLVWAFLVSKGAVQAKSRKQVATTAAHVEAAAHDPPAVLEGRKRALLAALKEIEVAKMNNEMPTDVYDVVKADLKKQAVTVMRALETATAAGEAGKTA